MEHRPRKRFGQNFLHDPGAIRRILAAVDARPGEHLVEIGPGQGVLSIGLQETAGELDLIELDRDLIGPLRHRLAASAGSGRPARARVHNVDALEIDLCMLAQVSSDDIVSDAERPIPAPPPTETLRAKTRLRVVGNLPYNISTPLLFRLIEQASCIQDMHLMLQKEVVDRITAAPGSKTYGRLSVMVQTHCSTERLFVIGPGAFHPAPKVDSAVVRLIPHRPSPYPIRDAAIHRQIVSAAFAQRRKTLRNSLRGLVSETQLAAQGLDPGARAERLAVAEFAALANAVAVPCIDPKIP